MVIPSDDNKCTIISSTKKIALIIEPDIGLTKLLERFLTMKGYVTISANSLYDIRSRVNTMRVTYMVPALIMMCPACPGASNQTLTGYVKHAFPGVKIIYTMKPKTIFDHSIKYLNLKDSSKSWQYKAPSYAKEVRMALRKHEVLDILRQQSVMRLLESKKMKEKRLIEASKPQEIKSSIRGLLTELFNTKLTFFKSKFS